MKYTEADLTEATKLIAHLRSVQRYAIAVLFLSILYFGFRAYRYSENLELYLLSSFTGVMIIGILLILSRLNHKTIMVYGFSCIASGGMLLFSLVYYQNRTPVILTTIYSVIGILLIRHGVSSVFGKRYQRIFSRANQQKISLVKSLIKSMKQSLPNESNVIHCSYSDGGKASKMKIAFFDAIACFLLDGHPTPLFFDRSNIAIFELQDNKDFLHASIVADNHNWLEVDLTSDDFKKYQSWKDY